MNSGQHSTEEFYYKLVGKRSQQYFIRSLWQLLQRGNFPLIFWLLNKLEMNI